MKKSENTGKEIDSRRDLQDARAAEGNHAQLNNPPLGNQYHQPGGVKTGADADEKKNEADAGDEAPKRNDKS